MALPPRLWYRTPVPSLIRADTNVRRMVRVLEKSRLELLQLRTWSAVAALPEEASVLLLDLPEMPPAKEDLTQILRWRFKRPDLSLLLVDTGFESTALWSLPGGVDLIRIGIDEPRLVPRVISARFESWRERWLTRFLSAPVPLILRSALRELLRQSPASRTLAPDEMPLHTLTGLAPAIKVCREHLSRTASAHDFPLGKLADTWLAVLAVALYELEEVEWDEVALRCGYKSTTGLDALVSRCLDLQRGKIGGREWIGALEKFEKDLDHVLRK